MIFDRATSHHLQLLSQPDAILLPILSHELYAHSLSVQLPPSDLLTIKSKSCAAGPISGRYRNDAFTAPDWSV